MKQAQEVVREYLHITRDCGEIPFTWADNISKNANYCLYELVSEEQFTPWQIRNYLVSLLRFNSINEFRFFLESIGIDYVEIDGLNPKLYFFFSDDYAVIEAAECLVNFGFPWGVLGRLYVEEVSIFSKEARFLRGRLDGLVSLGFRKEQIVGFCLAFPCLFKGEEVLVEKVEFFSRLGFEKTEIGRFILSNPNVLSIKVHDRVI